MTYRNLLTSFAREEPGRIALTFAVGLVAQLLTLLLPIYVALSFDLLFNIQSHRARVLGFIPEAWTTTFGRYFLLFTALLLIRSAFDLWQRFLIRYVGELHLASLRRRLFDHQLRLSMHVYDRKGFGKYLLRYSGDLSSIRSFITKGIIRFVSDLLLVGLALWIFFRIDYRLGWAISGMFFLLAMAMYILDHRLHRASQQRRNAKSALLKFVNARLLGMVTVKAFNRHVPETRKFNKRVAKLLRLGKNFQAITSLIGAIIPFGLYLMVGAVMYVSLLVQQDPTTHVDAETFFLALLLLITLMPVFRRCFRVSMLWRNGIISYRKLANILELPLEKNGKEGTLACAAPRVRVQNLHFSYPGTDQPLFQGLNLDLEGGKIHAIQAPNGRGKTTLLKLILGIYRPGEGEILFDDHPIGQLQTKILRRKVAAVTPDCKLLGRRVFEAISYSRKASKRPPAQAMLEHLGLDETIQLDDPIGELGIQLSNGQRKMLMYARAFLTSKPLLLLDDPFEELDEQAKNAVIRQLHQWRGTHTILLFTQGTLPDSLRVDAQVQLPLPQRKEARKDTPPPSPAPALPSAK